MKQLAVVQIVLGLLSAWDAGYLIFAKNRTPEILLTPGPNNYLEVILTILGLAIFGAALAQRARQARLATLQTVSGTAVAVMAAALAGYDSNASYWEGARVSLLAFGALALALLVAVAGTLQLLRAAPRHDNPPQPVP